MRLKELWSRQPLGPWNAKVTINALTGHQAGRQTSIPYETLFQVVAAWTGPPPAFSAHRGATNVSAQDVVIVRSYTGAQQVARQAADLLRHGQVPDLRQLAGPWSVSPARTLL